MEGAKSRIYATTDASRGALKSMATEQGYTSFVIPCDVGGRFSVLTPVGLLPMAVAGIDIDEVMRGAKAAHGWYQSPDLADNAAYQYAALRNILYRKGKNIEVLANYEPSLQYLSEWWKQLYGESEGKDQKGYFRQRKLHDRSAFHGAVHARRKPQYLCDNHVDKRIQKGMCDLFEHR